MLDYFAFAKYNKHIKSNNALDKRNTNRSKRDEHHINKISIQLFRH